MSKRVYLSGSFKKKLKKQRDDKIKMLPRISDFLNNRVTTENSIIKSGKSTSEKSNDIVSTLTIQILLPVPTWLPI